MTKTIAIAPCLWFDNQAEEAAPEGMADMLKDHDSEKARRAMQSFLGMKKIDIAELERATRG
jgi:predicted 3-demethylubiquinone-9 3-methyltransferase (glyoxalase superfamily)